MTFTRPAPRPANKSFSTQGESLTTSEENTMERIQSPRTDDTAIEQEIQAKGLTAPSIKAIQGVVLRIA